VTAFPGLAALPRRTPALKLSSRESSRDGRTSTSQSARRGGRSGSGGVGVREDSKPNRGTRRVKVFRGRRPGGPASRGRDQGQGRQAGQTSAVRSALRRAPALREVTYRVMTRPVSTGQEIWLSFAVRNDTDHYVGGPFSGLLRVTAAHPGQPLRLHEPGPVPDAGPRARAAGSRRGPALRTLIHHVPGGGDRQSRGLRWRRPASPRLPGH
jgi:hypothetical protein